MPEAAGFDPSQKRRRICRSKWRERRFGRLGNADVIVLDEELAHGIL